MKMPLNLELSKQLLALSRKEPNARKRIRLLAVSLFFEGENRANISRRLNTARGSVNKWVSNYLENGLAGLENKPISGRPPKLTASQLKQLSNYIEDAVASDDGGRLTGDDILSFITTNLNTEFHPNHVYKLLKQLGFSWITSRSKHPKQSQEIQEAFKKVQPVNDPSHSI